MVKQELVDLSDEVWTRVWARLDGLSDAEYLWEPAPGCWSIRPRDDGSWRPDWPLPRPDPEPFTTVAWRLWHLTDMYGENRAPEWLGIAPQGRPIGRDNPDGAPMATADGALDLLDRAHARWDAHLALVTEEGLGLPIGSVGGDYGEQTRIAYVLHMLDEFVHHGAEIALLRDLWRWQHPLGVDPAVERAIRGDLTLVDDVGADASHLVSTAASYARWELVAALVQAGVPLPAGGTTPLHFAAVAGELDVVRLLVDHGADLKAEDPEFHATPLLWARFLKQHDVAAWLEQQGHLGP